MELASSRLHHIDLLSHPADYLFTKTKILFLGSYRMVRHICFYRLGRLEYASCKMNLHLRKPTKKAMSTQRVLRFTHHHSIRFAASLRSHENTQCHLWFVYSLAPPPCTKRTVGHPAQRRLPPQTFPPIKISRWHNRSKLKNTWQHSARTLIKLWTLFETQALHRTLSCENFNGKNKRWKVTGTIPWQTWPLTPYGVAALSILCKKTKHFMCMTQLRNSPKTSVRKQNLPIKQWSPESGCF